MRYSQLLIPTVKEAPNDAQTISHVLLARAGYVRRVGSGIYSFLPLGVRVLRKLERLVREELDRAGAQEVLLPALIPAEYLRETGRWEGFGDALFRLKDRKGGDYLLGPTHEEIITDLARHELRSYRDLPKNLYQIQTKFRDEPRPRGGLLRCREFTMKDAYSFDTNLENAKQSYARMRLAYIRIFDRLGLDYRAVAADSGAMGGALSEEFQVLVQSGEDFIVVCEACDYAANLEVAAAAAPIDPDRSGVPSPKKVYTPNARSIDEVSKFLSVRADRLLKSLVFVTDGKALLAVVRGDHELNETKLRRALATSDVRPAEPHEVRAATGAEVGFAGPVGFTGRILIDRDAAAVADAIVGANQSDHHLQHVTFGRDFDAEPCDLRNVGAGDRCPKCASPLAVFRGIEAGHIFLLGTRYSEAMHAMYLAEEGSSHAIVMGCYGIGISRLIATAVEQHHDADGICWPLSIAPFQVHVVQIGADPNVVAEVERLERALEAEGIEVLVDDRAERPGVKFKDADLIGIPLRVDVGQRGLANANVEVKTRELSGPRSSEHVALADAARVIAERIRL